MPIDPSLVSDETDTQQRILADTVPMTNNVQTQPSQPPMASLVPPPCNDSFPGSTTSETTIDRIALQRSLALLAAQLADLATEDDTSADSVLPISLPTLTPLEWPTLAEAATVPVVDEG